MTSAAAQVLTPFVDASQQRAADETLDASALKFRCGDSVQIVEAAMAVITNRFVAQGITEQELQGYSREQRDILQQRYERMTPALACKYALTKYGPEGVARPGLLSRK